MDEELNAQEAQILKLAERLLAAGKSEMEVNAFIDRAVGRLEKNAADQRQAAGLTGSQRARLLAQGATLNFGDEIEAGVRALGPNTTYADEIQKVRGDLDNARTDAPGESLALELAGGLVPGLGGAKLLKLGAGRTIDLAGKLLAGSTTSGAVAGAGSGEDARSRTMNAGIGAATGFALGKAGERLVARGERTKAGRAVLEAAGVPNERSTIGSKLRLARTPAEKAAVKALDIVDVDEAAKNLALRSPSAQANLVTVGGERTARAARALRNVDAPGAQALRGDVEGIRRGQVRELDEAITSASGFDPEDITRSGEELVAARGEKAATNYADAAQAYQQNQSTEAQSAIAQALADPDVRPYVERAMNVRSVRGRAETDFEVLDRAYKLMTERSGMLKEARSNPLTRGNADLADQENVDGGLAVLRQALDLATEGKYGQALADFAGESSYLRAMKEGTEKFGTMLPDEVEGAVRNAASDADREAFKRGAATNLRRQVRKGQVTLPLAGRVGRDATRTLLTDDQLAKFTALNGPEAAKKLEDALTASAQDAQAYNALTGNSTTAMQLSDEVGITGSGPLAAAIAMLQNPASVGSLVRANATIGPALAKLSSGKKEEALARILGAGTKNRSTLDALLEALKTGQERVTPNVDAGRLAGNVANRAALTAPNYGLLGSP